MDYWLIFQSLIKDVITWGGTMMDRGSVKVNLTFKQRDSLSAMIGLPLGVRSAPGGDSSCG